jgi:transposase
MFDVNDDAKGGFRRIEILTGLERWRPWSAEEKGQVVAETL